MQVELSDPSQEGLPKGLAVGPGARDMQQPMAVAMGVAVPPYQMSMGAGMQQLARLPTIQVQEKAQWLQEVTAMLGVEFEMANKYRVLDEAGNQVFYAVEKTDCLRRQCQNSACADCISWEVDVLYTPPGGLMQKFLAMRRPFSFVCCCLNRPTADVIDETTGQKLGSFRDPCTCVSLRFEVRDASDSDMLVVNGGTCCMQPGLLCPLPCGPCAEIQFDVEDARSGATVGQITKRVPSFLTWLFAPDVDNYHVNFGEVQNPQWKAIMLAFTIFLDFRYFNINTQEQRQDLLFDHS